MFNHSLESMPQVEQATLRPYLPYPKYNSPEWKQKWVAEYVPCHSTKYIGTTIRTSESAVQSYKTSLHGFPEPLIGSHDAVGLDGNVCFDRYGRYSTYGFDPMARFNSRFVARRKKANQVNWMAANWGGLQNECVELNQRRFHGEARNAPSMRPGIQLQGEFSRTIDYSAGSKHNTRAISYAPRTAILLRSWSGYQYEENDLQAVRSMITETSLMTGGQYQVILLVHLLNQSLPVFDDQTVYEEQLRKHVPEELHSIALLWTDAIFSSWYPNIEKGDVHSLHFMPLQWFSHTHPEFEYIWNWEMHARYIGNHYHFLSEVEEFSAKQPRKYLWERNKRYYIPTLHGRNYDSFVKNSNDNIERSAAAGKIEKPIWGPVPHANTVPPQVPIGPAPPWPEEEDNFSWGVGEEADLITLLPIWDPRDTDWAWARRVWNYIPDNRQHEAADRVADDVALTRVNRRASINTVLRVSKRLLRAMHEENKAGRSMASEMWPASAALHHGLKAVYAPHPIWADRRWDPLYADLVFNRDDGVGAKWSEGRHSAYNRDSEHNFHGWTWYTQNRFARVLYRRWLGWKVRDGMANGTETVVGEELGRGKGMCLPGMLLYPVKDMREDLL